MNLISISNKLNVRALNTKDSYIDNNKVYYLIVHIEDIQ